jgi:DNA-binding cell septation regulator SpoVG
MSKAFSSLAPWSGLNISAVQIHPVNHGSLLARATITLAKSFVIHNFEIRKDYKTNAIKIYVPCVYTAGDKRNPIVEGTDSDFAVLRSYILDAFLRFRKDEVNISEYDYKSEEEYDCSISDFYSPGTKHDSKLLAFVSISVNGLRINRLTILQGKNSQYVAMPVTDPRGYSNDKKIRNIAYPIVNDFRLEIQETILMEFFAEIDLEKEDIALGNTIRNEEGKLETKIV